MLQFHTPSSRVAYELTDDRSRIDLPQLMVLYETTGWARGRGIGPALVRSALDHTEREMAMVLRR